MFYYHSLICSIKVSEFVGLSKKGDDPSRKTFKLSGKHNLGHLTLIVFIGIIYRCGLCDENITVNPKEDFWCSLQAHEHFEELYCQFLNGDLKTPVSIEDVNRKIVQTTSESESTPTDPVDFNTDSSIEQQDLEMMHVS